MGIVVLFHAGVPGFSGGFAGVDVFFVLSGFLITSLLVRDLDSGRLSLRRFYERRVRRLLPAAATMSLVVVGVATLTQRPETLARTGAALVASTFYVSNVYFWRSTDYFAPEGHTQPLLHTWSLSVEEQFYLVAPLLILLLHRRGRTWLRGGLWALTVTSFLLAVVATPLRATASFYLLPPRGWELLAGALLAVGALPWPSGAAARTGLGISGLLALAFTTFGTGWATPFPSWPALLPVFATLALLQTEGPLSRALSTPALRWLGLRSYSLYLWHWPVLVLLPVLLVRPATALERAGAVVVSLALAEASYRWVETPFRQPSHAAYPGPRAFLAMAATMVLAAVAGTGLLQSNGLASRYPAFVVKPIIEEGLYGRSPCFQSESGRGRWRPDRCALGRGPDVLFLGDSFGAHYWSGLVDADLDARLLMRHRSRCPPIPYPSVPTCDAFNRDSFDIAAESHDEVVLAARWQLYDAPAVERGLRQQVQRLADEGIAVTVIGQSPVLPADVVALAIHDDLQDPTTTATSRIDDQPALNRRLAAIVEQAGGRFIDPLATFCDERECRYRADGDYLFSDIGHFSRAGSRLAVQAYFPHVRHPSSHE